MSNTGFKYQGQCCPKPVWACLELPVTDYRQALRLQQNLVSARASRALNRDIVLVLQHFPVFTLGNRGGEEHLHVSGDFLEARGISLVETDRGGSITYHGPGQLVAYPVVDLPLNGWLVVDFVHALESVMISIAGQWGVAAQRHALGRGAWVRGKKIGSVGLRVSRKVSFHGLALNVDPHLDPFDWIAPCGLSGIQMTSIARETGGPVSMNKIARSARAHFSSVFNVELEPVPADYVADYWR
ncbi:lipoate-protein ligase B [Desulfosalsimonas propionicica]|uniref:Octanoyltransferase n=1 Tax=Desulfosalsimonas propionicica TaxID=332175 RepID=A0A7W0C9A1_9BACT|nr:lipoyl(octanoyl) transferase LipB [Desulfosalsimonas propionicica]MBA2881512.1 lipoate-protein ligase B [Desulfosalsimonas propionicica]